MAVLVARALAGETAAMVAGLRGLPRPPVPGLARVSRRQGGRDLPRRDCWRCAWPAGLAACATWLAAAFAFRFSSLAALVAAAAAPLWLWLFGRPTRSGSGLALAVLVFVRHHANIRRLLAGTEPRIGKGK